MEFRKFLGVNAEELDGIVKTGYDVVSARMQGESLDFTVECLTDL